MRSAKSIQGRGQDMITLNDVREAQKRIEGYVLRTPLLRVPALDEFLGCEVYLKPENLQHTGSFKLRGATNCILSLGEEEKKKGIVACSSGNHAQGVACAAKRCGIDAVIIMPTNCNPVKLEGVKSFGAKVLLVGTLGSEREAKAQELMESEGRTQVHPYANDFIRAGQGTVGLEILEDEPDMDTVVVPIGGGGLITGISTAVKGIRPDIRVIGMEPAGAPRYSISRKEGRPVALTHVDTIADGTRTDHAEPENFKAIERLVDSLVAVDDEAIKKAMKIMVSKAKVVAEPSSVMGVAAALSGKLPVKKGEKVCFVLSGGNNDLNQLAEILAQP